MKTVAVTGATGLLGPYLMEAAGHRGRAVGWSRHTQPAVDLTDAEATRAAVAALAPDVVVHAAGLTDVDRCEREPELADSINRATTTNLVVALPRAATLVYVSTDQVYPDRPGLHREGGEAPVNAYGNSKLAGERAARAHPKSLVLRLNLFGPSRTPGRESLSDFFVRSMSARNPTMLFRDSLFSPLHMSTIATILFDLVEAGVTGTYNLGSHEGMSKRDFALAIAGHLGLPTDLTRDVNADQLPGRAARPRDLRLDVARIETALGRKMPTLAQEVARL